MGRSNIAVSDEIADRLSKISAKENKTSYAVANECLDAALEICEKGGRLDEIFGAWMMNHIGKDIGAFQWVGRNLMEQVVRDFEHLDPQKFARVWHEAGFNFGVYMQICFPKIDDVVSLVKQLQQSFNIGRVDFLEDPRTPPEEKADSFHLSIVTSTSAELLKYMAEYLCGLLEAYGLEPVDRKIVSGALRLQFLARDKLSKVGPSVINQISSFKGME